MAARECVIEEKLPKITPSLANQQEALTDVIMHLSPRWHAGLLVPHNALFIWCLINPTFFSLMINFLNLTFVCRHEHNADL